MTDQINRECLEVVSKEQVAAPQDEPSHRIRSFLAKSAIVACSTLGAAVSLISQQPSAERTIGPVTIDADVAFGQDIEVLGLSAADSKYGIGMDVSIKAPDLEQIPEISRRLAPISQQIASKNNNSTVLELVQEEYYPEINSMKNELIAESLLYLGVGALAGGYLSAKVLERLGQDRRTWKFIVASSMAGMLVVGGAEFQSLGSVNTTEAADRLSTELRQPFDEYLMTSTSDMLVNLDSINDETRKQIARLVRISNALSRQPSIAPTDAQTWVIYSDSHGLPTAPETIETLAQSANADAILGEGDYGNTGNELEMDLLDGLSFDGTNFIGFNDIRSCASWDTQNSSCTKRGDRLPHGALSGNHDPAIILSLFDQLGMDNLDKAKTFNGIPIISLADACFVDSSGCRGDDAKTVNQEYAKQQLFDLQSSGDPLPKIGFFASYDAANEFIGEIDTLIVGGRHEYSRKSKDGSDIYYVPTVGQAFPRGAREAGALILSIQSDGTLLQCSNVSWQTLQAKSPTITDC